MPFPLVNLFVIPCEKTREEQFVLIVDKFVSDPLQFQFSFGEKIALQEAVRMSKRIFEDYSKQYTFSRTTEKRKSSMCRDTSTQKKPRSDNVSSNVCVGPSTTAAVESATTVTAAATELLTRKGKTLHECVKKWYRNAKLFVEKKIAYLQNEFEIIAESSSIKCLKCNSIIKTDVDENGCWEINRFENFRSRFYNVAKVDVRTVGVE